MIKKRTKIRIFKTRLFASRACLLVSRSEYRKTILYLALHSLLSCIFCTFLNFASIPLYRETKQPLSSLYIGSASTLPDSSCNQWLFHYKRALHAQIQRLIIVPNGSIRIIAVKTVLIIEKCRSY